MKDLAVAGFVVLILAVLGLRTAGGGGAEVHIVYLVPSDKEEMPQARMGSINALRHLQRWYSRQLGDGRTFRIAGAPFRVVKTSHPQDWYRQHPGGPDPKMYWFDNAVADARRGVFWQTGFVVILLDADVEGHSAEAAAHLDGQYAVMPWRYVRAYAGQNIEPPCHAVGVLGHELGHLFGLSHPSNCVSADGYRTHNPPCDSIMYNGTSGYPGSFLTEGDKARLRSHSAFRKIDLPESSNFDCDRLLTAKDPR